MKSLFQSLLTAFDISVEQMTSGRVLSIPGKTFLAGEYLALSGGQALVMSTAPKFELSVRLTTEKNDNPFHPQSPAGKLWLIHQKFLQYYEIEFYDPYACGGFGASSSQFALLWTALQFLKQQQINKNVNIVNDYKIDVENFSDAEGINCDNQKNKNLKLIQKQKKILSSSLNPQFSLNYFFDLNLAVQKEPSLNNSLDQIEIEMASCLLFDYRSLAEHQGKAPSGVDILGPFFGGLSVVQREPSLQIEKVSWPFVDKSVLLFHTQKKLATHDHISQIQQIPVSQFASQIKLLLQGLQSSDWEMFLLGLSGYRQTLEQNNWVAVHTAEILAYLDACPQVLFAKGCGAMGADVVAVFCAKSAKEVLIAEIQEKGLILMASEENITDGISILADVF